MCVVLALGAFALIGCNTTPVDPPENGAVSIKVVMPDGAPALSMAQLMKENMQFGEEVSYEVVAAGDIKKFVTGNGEKADIALLPVNAASLMLGQGTEYKMVAAVTHGNLYLLSKNGEAITADNAKEKLSGKKIAIVNIAAVPGLTAKAMLKKLGVEYTEKASEAIMGVTILKGIAGTEIASSLNSESDPVDFVIAPEPAVSTITAKAPVIKKVGALHDIYGRYPQAVMVAKTSLLESNKKLVVDIFNAMVDNEEWVKANPADAATAVAAHLTEGVTPTFSAANTTTASVEGSGIDVVNMTQDAIAEIDGYIADVMALESTSPVAKAFPKTFFFDLKA